MSRAKFEAKRWCGWRLLIMLADPDVVAWQTDAGGKKI